MESPLGQRGRHPKTSVEASRALATAMRLASSGWWGGNPERILRAPADVVIAALQYEDFKSDYEAAYIELNRETK